MDDFARKGWRQKPLRIIRDHDDVTVVNGCIELGQNRSRTQRTGRWDIFVIQPHDLLLLADDPHFSKRGEPVIDAKQIDARVCGALSQQDTGFIGANERNQRCTSAERDDVRGGIRSAAERVPARVHLQHRHRSLRRNPAAVAE